MPFVVVKDTDACPAQKPWAVKTEGTDHVHGCHASQSEAQEQQQALYANVPDAQRSEEPMEVRAPAKKKQYVGLTDAIKSKFKSDLADSDKNPTVHVSAALHRLNEWAASGHYPTGLDYEDVRWLAEQCVKELHKREGKDSTASMDDFPGPKGS